MSGVSESFCAPWIPPARRIPWFIVLLRPGGSRANSGCVGQMQTTSHLRTRNGSHRSPEFPRATYVIPSTTTAGFARRPLIPNCAVPAGRRALGIACQSVPR